MTSEERALEIMEWLNTDDEEYIATLDKIKDMFDQHAVDQREYCAYVTKRKLESLSIYRFSAERILEAILNARMEKEDD